MIDLLFRGIQRRLIERVSEAEIVDYFLDQYDESSGDQRIYITPALYIEFEPTTFETLTQGIQKSTQVFHIHTVHASLYEDENRILSNDALNNFLRVQRKVYAALMNFRLQAKYVNDTEDERILMESIVRIRSIPDHAMSRLLVNTQTFQAVVYDYDAYKDEEPVIVSPNVIAMLAQRLN